MQDNGMMQLNQDASFQEFACTALVFVVGVVIITFHAIETSYGEATNHSTQHRAKARNARSETRLQGYTTPLLRPSRTLVAYRHHTAIASMTTKHSSRSQIA